MKSSQDLSSGWSATNTGSSNPTITGNTSESPACADVYNLEGCGLTKADRLQVPALSDAQSSFIYQSSVCPAGPHSAGVYLKGTSASGVVNLYTGELCVACPYTAASWSRCTASGGTSGGTFAIGNIATVGTGDCDGAKEAADVQVWQADCQNRSTITPPIGPTGALSVTRPAGHVNGATKKLAGMGDSITFASGSGLDPTPVRVANVLGPEYAWIQGGVPGDTCEEVLARWPAVKAQLAAGDRVFLMCGVNDARTGRTAAEAWADAESLLEDARTSGFSIRPVVPLNFEGAADADPGKVAVMNTLRASYAAYCVAHSIECADPAVDLQTGNEIKDEYDQDDKIHLNGPGQLIFQKHIAKGTWP